MRRSVQRWGSFERQELERAARWLCAEDGLRSPPPYFDYLNTPELRAMCGVLFNPFAYQEKLLRWFQQMEDKPALLVCPGLWRGQTTQAVGLETDRVWDWGLCSRSELRESGWVRQTAGCGICAERVRGSVGECQTFWKGILLLTAEVVKRAAETYPNAVFLGLEDWPALLRVH